MKVILLVDVRGVGRRYEVKEVHDGYARNFLIPQKLAVLADEKQLAAKKSHDEQEAGETERLQKLADKLAKEVFEFKIKAGAKGEVFGSVSKKDIEGALRNTPSAGAEVVLEHPIKATGEHEVEVSLGRGVKAKVKILIKPSEQ